MTAEDFAASADFFDQTLAVVPRAPDALLGKARALTYLGRHEDAHRGARSAAGAERWYIGDARYWRALNESQLGRNDEAWTDIEAAAKLLINAEVPKLAGIIAYRRHSSTCRGRSSRNRSGANAADCETGYYLGSCWRTSASGQRARRRAASTPPRACRRRRAELARQIADDSRLAQIRRRGRRVRLRGASSRSPTGRRMLATSWFDTAVAYYNLSRKSEARQFAEKGRRRRAVRRARARAVALRPVK